MIGYFIEQELGNLLPFEKPLATILTMTEVDPDDPAFADPSKFVGPVYDEAEATRLAAQQRVDGQAGRGPLASGRAVPAAPADLRDPADQVAARPGRRRGLHRGWRDPHDVPAGATAATPALSGSRP